jgi:hypothetical protein
MRLEHWSVVLRDVNPYQPPEHQKVYLHGKVYGHHNFADGEWVTTSCITGHFKGRVLTQNSIYDLEEVDPEYEKLYPQARERLFATLKLMP